MFARFCMFRVARKLRSTWTCGRCTLENGWHLEECGACHSRRGAFPKVVVVVLDDKAVAKAVTPASGQLLALVPAKSGWS